MGAREGWGVGLCTGPGETAVARGETAAASARPVAAAVCAWRAAPIHVPCRLQYSKGTSTVLLALHAVTLTPINIYQERTFDSIDGTPPNRSAHRLHVQEERASAKWKRGV